MNSALYDWFNQTLARQATRKDLQLRAFDARGDGLLSLELDNTHIRQIVFPKITSENASTALIKLTVQPQTVERDETFSGGLNADPADALDGFTFKLATQTLQDIQAVGPIVVDQTLTTLYSQQSGSGAGAASGTPYTAEAVSIASFDVTTDRNPLSILEDWFDSSVVQGQTNDPQHQRAASLDLREGSNTVLRLAFSKLGILGAVDNASLTERTYSLYTPGRPHQPGLAPHSQRPAAQRAATSAPGNYRPAAADDGATASAAADHGPTAPCPARCDARPADEPRGRARRR